MRAFMFPGQGSQKRGMGAALFSKYPALIEEARRILGYDPVTLCVTDPEQQLSKTQYTQPAMYIVNALHWLDASERDGRPDYLLGHSLGEYTALFAAGAYDFGTGLQLVQQRAALMGKVQQGGMAAVAGLNWQQIKKILQDHQLHSLDIANYNTATQLVLSGPKADIITAQQLFESNGAQLYFPLNVSGAFHSCYMQDAAAAYHDFISRFTFQPLQIPVIANVTGRPYTNNSIPELLCKQITAPVKWYESVSYLIHQGVRDLKETGPGDVLKKMNTVILGAPMPAETMEATNGAATTKATGAPAAATMKTAAVAAHPPVVTTKTATVPLSAALPPLQPEKIGAASYRKRYNVKYAYASGGMVHGIASRQMIVRMGKAGLMSYLGTGGLSADEVENDIRFIQQELKNGEPFGINMINGSREEDMATLIIQHDIRNVEASAYMTHSAPLIKIRLKGLRRNPDGTIFSPRRIMAKLSRPEVADIFLSPATANVALELFREGSITAEEMELGKKIPLADDICVEADSGGHTDQGVAWVLVPTIMRMRDAYAKKFGYAQRIHIGAAGGIGTPEAAAAAFILGADFILTGSINQCTIESGTSETVKEMLSQLNIQDTTYAPAGDMFELGARIQVMKKGVFFPVRANKLYELYKQYNSIEEIHPDTKKQIEEKYFRKNFEEIYQEVKTYCPPAYLELAERNPKQKMAFIFRWYFGHTARLAMQGDKNQSVDFQVHCGPAMGAFNQWVKGTPLENWRNRHVDVIAEKLMQETAAVLHHQIKNLYGHTP